LQLVIPFAGLESILNQTGLPNLFKSINFNDGTASSSEIDTMRRIHETLIQTKPLIQTILAVGEDNRFLSHPGMREYYCRNATNAVASYDSCAGTFAGTVRVFHDKFPDHKPPLGITIDEAREIRNLKGGVPDFCR